MQLLPLGVAVAPVVRAGADCYQLPGGASVDSAQDAIRWYKGHEHSTAAVYGEMLLQIMMDYPALPDAFNLTLRQILFFYNGRRGSLKKATRPKDG